MWLIKVTFDLCIPVYLVTSFICALTDTARRRIYNSVIISGTVLAAVSHIYLFPRIDILSVFLMLFFLAVLFFFFTKHLIGGGDIKLYTFTAFSWPSDAGLRITAVSVAAAAAWSMLRLLTASITGTGVRSELRRGIPMALFVFGAAIYVLINERIS